MMSVGNTQVHDAVTLLDITDIATIASLAAVLDEHSKVLASDEELRRRTGESTPSIWPDLQHIWSVVEAAHSSPEADGRENVDEEHLRSLCLSTARFTRNLVASIRENQSRAFENEPSIRKLLHYYTSYSATEDEKALVVTRMLVQTLSNLITANEDLIDQLWGSYLQIPEERMVLIRLVAVVDPNTTVASFVLILNSLIGSRTRMNLLTASRSGIRLCITYLDRMAMVFEAADTNPGSSRAFDIGYRIFSVLMEEGIIPEVYARIGVQDEVITPHQTTLLKLVDAYLQPSNVRAAHISDGHASALCVMLLEEFFSMTNYTQTAIRRALGSDSTRSTSEDVSSAWAQAPTRTGNVGDGANHLLDDQPLQELDLMLPKVCEALVLVTQGLISLALFSEETFNSLASTERTSEQRTDNAHLKDYVNHSTSHHGLGSIEALTETLRLLDVFLPRITFGKVAPPAVPVGYAPGGGSGRPVDEQAPHTNTHNSDPKGFAYLKRDLVRLLGILASDCREVQDRIRGCGGIPVVLNLCVIDDRNPFLREHAIFALRNILHGNAENQAVIHEIQPVGEWERGLS